MMNLIHSLSLPHHLTLPPLHHHHHLITPPSPSPSPPPPPPPLIPSPGLEFRSKLLYLESLNINSLKALTLNPSLRTTPLETLTTNSQTLTTLFRLHPTHIGRILDMFPQLLTASTTATLFPISEFLLCEVGLSVSELPRAINRCPRILVSDLDLQLRPTLLFLRHRLRFRRIGSQNTVLLVSSVEHTLVPKLCFLGELGFRDEEVVNLVQRSPALLTYSIQNNLVPKIEYFFEEMDGDLSEIKEFPQYFSFSLEGKIKPRHRLLEENGISMTLKEMLKVSDGEFNVRLLETRLQHSDLV